MESDVANCFQFLGRTVPVRDELALLGFALAGKHVLDFGQGAAGRLGRQGHVVLVQQV